MNENSDCLISRRNRHSVKKRKAEPSQIPEKRLNRSTTVQPQCQDAWIENSFNAHQHHHMQSNSYGQSLNVNTHNGVEKFKEWQANESLNDSDILLAELVTEIEQGVEQNTYMNENRHHRAEPDCHDEPPANGTKVATEGSHHTEKAVGKICRDVEDKENHCCECPLNSQPSGQPDCQSHQCQSSISRRNVPRKLSSEDADVFNSSINSCDDLFDQDLLAQAEQSSDHQYEDGASASNGRNDHFHGMSDSKAFGASSVPKNQRGETEEIDELVDVSSNRKVGENLLSYNDIRHLGHTVDAVSRKESGHPDSSLYGGIQQQHNAAMHTPTTTTAGGSKGKGSSLKDRLKQRLIQNTANTRTNTSPARLNIEELHQENLTKAKLEASQIRREGIVDGIGPFYGLPSRVPEMLTVGRKITKLYDWQEECLKLPAVYEGRNLIYTLPTSGGKTLVAEILILRQLLCKKKDALLILPYISIVQEKVRILSEFATELGFLVEEYAGSKGRFPPTKRRQKHSLFVATIEKAQSLVNCLVEAGRLEELGLVVVDELHMIGEGGSRGAAMESTLLKLQYAAKESPQVIGMSATLNNISDLAQFLNAEVFSSDFRPVSLTEYVKVEDNLYQVDSKALVPEDKLQYHKTLTFQKIPESSQMDPDSLLDLVLEIIPHHSCLLFCPTKRYCENVALMLARLMAKNHRHLSSLQKEKRRSLLQELHSDGGGNLCPTLRQTIPYGLAYHHSGLTTDERRLIEDAYSDGVLCLLMCTSTLAAGVNLPAKRVILRSPYVGADFIKHSQYKQMTGRAGRAGIDSSGESILIAKKTDMPKVIELLSGPQDVCHSSLMHQEGKGLRSLILSLIGLKLVDTTQTVFSVMQRTLLAVQAKRLKIDILAAIQTALQELLDQGLVIQKRIQDLSPQQRQTMSQPTLPHQKNSAVQQKQQSSQFSVQQKEAADMMSAAESKIAASTAVATNSKISQNGRFCHLVDSQALYAQRGGHFVNSQAGIDSQTHVKSQDAFVSQSGCLKDTQREVALQNGDVKCKDTKLKVSQSQFAVQQGGMKISHMASVSQNQYMDSQRILGNQSQFALNSQGYSQSESQGMFVSLNGQVRCLDSTGLFVDSQYSQDLFVNPTTQITNGNHSQSARDEWSSAQKIKCESAKMAEYGTSTQAECPDGKGEDCEHSAAGLPSAEELKLEVTELGKATFKGSVDLQFGSRLYKDLKQGEQSLVVANYLHLLYLVTPYDLAEDLMPNWMLYMHQMGTLAADELKVASLVGVTESYITRRASGQSSRQKVDLSVVRRFYLTLMLHELWKQYTVWEVAERFQLPRGFIQNLLSSAASFSSCVLRFAQELPEFWAYQDLLGNFGKRLTYCVSMELVPLMEVPGVKLGRARQLYGAGFDSIQSLASAEPGQLVAKVQFLTLKAARQIVAAAKVILEEKTSALLEQVEMLVPMPQHLTEPQPSTSTEPDPSTSVEPQTSAPVTS